MPDQKPTKKDFADLINSVMGQKIMTEDQLSKFLDDAKNAKENRGTEGLLEYIQRVTDAPANKDQLRRLANEIQDTGNPFSAIDFLKNEKLISDHQLRKLNQALDTATKKKKKK